MTSQLVQTAARSIVMDDQTETAELKRIASASPWIIPRTQNVGGRAFDSADAFTARGFAVFNSLSDDMFYRALPPRDWTRELSGRYLVIRDSAGVIRARCYIRLARMVRCSYVKFEC